DQGVGRLRLVFEDTRRTDVHVHLLGNGEGLHHRAVRGDVAPQDRDPAVGRERLVSRPDDLVPADLDVPQVAQPLSPEERVPVDLLEVLADGLAGDGEAVEVQQVAQLEHQGGHTAGVPEVLGRVDPGRHHVGHDRDVPVDAVEIVDRDLSACLPGDLGEV